MARIRNMHSTHTSGERTVGSAQRGRWSLSRWRSTTWQHGRRSLSPLRRVLAHALDPLNQIDQWQRWRRDGLAPTPTDGWAPSTVTLPEDRLPLTPTDLDAWLWRIDQAMRLLTQRAATLGQDELDWQPPDGGWPLRRVLHHVARSELLYAASFDEALPEDPAARYAEADARFSKRLVAAGATTDEQLIVF